MPRAPRNLDPALLTVDTPTKGIDTGAVTTVDIEVVLNRTLGIIGYEYFDLRDLFSHEQVPFPISLFLDDSRMISASSK